MATEPTREQLQLAYRQLARPDRWPRTLDAALAHPTFGICLRALARQLGRPAWFSAGSAPANAVQPPIPPNPPAPRPRPASRINETWPPRRGGGVDLKRAAANDRDD
jgi:hypothetical protein